MHLLEAVIDKPAILLSASAAGHSSLFATREIVWGFVFPVADWSASPICCLRLVSQHLRQLSVC